MSFAKNVGRFLMYVLAASLAIPVSGTTAFAVTQLVSCGMVVSGEVELPADLDCSAAPLPSVEFSATGSLALNGHTLIGEVLAASNVLTVLGPGTITGPGYGVYNVGGMVSARVKVFGANIMNNEASGIVAYGDLWRTPASVSVTDGSVSGNGGYGIISNSVQRLPNIYPRSPITLIRTTVDGNGACGLSSCQLSAKDSSVSGNGDCGVRIVPDYKRSVRIKTSHIDANVGAAILTGITDWGSGRVKILDASIVGNGDGIEWYGYKVDGGLYNNKLTLKRTIVENNDHGVRVIADGLRVVSSDISDNGITGITFTQLTGRHAVVRATSVTGNGTSAECGVSVACADLDTDMVPSVDSVSTCDTSHVYGSGIPGSSWGICASD